MKCKLMDVCRYRKDRISVDQLNLNNYISTENMLTNKNGITQATGLPTITTTQAFRAGDILVSNIRPYFRKIYFSKFSGGCSNDVLVFEPYSNVNSKFLYYVLSDDRFFDHCTATAKGTKMPRGDKGSIMQYQINLPDLPTQRKIAKILSTLDDKIELNNRINQNLEAQAQAIFDKNLADLSELPVGWSKGSLLDIADYLNGLAMQKFRPNVHEVGLPVLKIKELRQGMCDNDSEQCSPTIQKDYIVHDGDVVFSWSGSLLVDLWCGGVCGLNQHLFKVTSKKYSKWFYYFWTKYHLGRFIAIAAAKATTMGHIKREDLSNAEVIIPSKDDFKKFDNILSPLLNLMIKNRIENRRLSALRDTLLPKLMSGELDVENLNV